MTTYFKNKGEINVEDALLLGASAKTTDNPFGYFGTGLKYAIAVILREGGAITIWSGKSPYTFTVETVKVRDGTTEEQVIHMNGQRQYWTTNLGKNWKVWQAFRELYCNMKDEEEGEASASKVQPKEGQTTIVVSKLEEFDVCYRNRKSFILEGKPIYTHAGCEIYEGGSEGIYYQGILVGTLEKPSMYTYNLTTHQTLTEDRTLKYPFMAKAQVACALTDCHNEDILVQVLGAEDHGWFESTMPYQELPDMPGKEWMDTAGEMLRRGERLNDQVVKCFDKWKADISEPEAVTLTAHEQSQLDDALKVIEEVLGYEITKKYQVVVVQSLGSGVYGKAARRKIYLSRRTFEAGSNWLIGTLIEEFGHLQFDWRDETRDMQNSLMNIIAQLTTRIYQLSKETECKN